MASGLERLADDLWTVSQPLRFLGAEIGARMTVVRLPDGRLFLHAPIEPTPELRAEVEALGEVAHAVAPNRMHHLWVDRWHDLGADVQIHVAPGLASKRPDLSGYDELGDVPDPGWSGTLDQVFVRGMPFMNEVDFLHRPSRTLLACDLAFNTTPEQPWWTRASLRLLGVRGELSTSLSERLMSRDREATRASLERLFAWDFDRVVVAHRRVVETGGKEALRRAWAWLLEKD